MAQVDHLAGVRSTSSTLSVACLAVTHGGRAATVSHVDNLDMLDVAAATSAQAARDDRLVAVGTQSAQEGDEFARQLIAAAVVDVEQSLVAVLLHCGTMTRTFVAQVVTAAGGQGLVAVASTVLSLEASLEVRRASRINSHNFL